MKTKQEFKETFGRLIENDEIVFDVDSREFGFEAINFIAINLYNQDYGFEIWYAENQKSPHLHIKKIMGLGNLNYEQQKKYKELFLKKYCPEEYQEFLDFQLCGKHRIAEENKPHYKYKTIKQILNVWNNYKANFVEAELLEQAKQTPTYSNVVLLTPKNVDLRLMEKNCLWLKDTIKKTNLNHEERSALMFLYMKLGKHGEARLKEILKRQKNYSETKTNYIINYYKKQKKFYGISCKKLIEKRLCKFSKCSTYREEKTKLCPKIKTAYEVLNGESAR